MEGGLEGPSLLQNYKILCSSLVRSRKITSLLATLPFRLLYLLLPLLIASVAVALDTTLG